MEHLERHANAFQALLVVRLRRRPCRLLLHAQLIRRLLRRSDLTKLLLERRNLFLQLRDLRGRLVDLRGQIVELRLLVLLLRLRLTHLLVAEGLVRSLFRSLRLELLDHLRDQALDLRERILAEHGGRLNALRQQRELLVVVLLREALEKVQNVLLHLLRLRSGMDTVPIWMKEYARSAAAPVFSSRIFFAVARASSSSARDFFDSVSSSAEVIHSCWRSLRCVSSSARFFEAVSSSPSAVALASSAAALAFFVSASCFSPKATASSIFCFSILKSNAAFISAFCAAASSALAFSSMSSRTLKIPPDFDLYAAGSGAPAGWNSRSESLEPCVAWRSASTFALSAEFTPADMITASNASMTLSIESFEALPWMNPVLAISRSMMP